MEGRDLVIYFGQSGISHAHEMFKWEEVVGYKNLNFPREIWTGNINVVVINMQTAFKATKRKRGQRANI